MNRNLFIAVLSSGTLLALPQGSMVKSGQVEIANASDAMRISASDRAIIQWDDFSIGLFETVTFTQPDCRATVLNQVSSLRPSELLGSLEANGRVYLVNPSGIVVGSKATVDTASFLASTLEVSESAFLESGPLLFQGDAAAPIINLGTIRSRLGNVTIFAHQIEQNGHVLADKGTVSLIAGHQILLQSSDNPILQIRPDLPGGSVETMGTIQALQVQIESDGAKALSIRQHPKSSISLVESGGKILLRSTGGSILNEGTLTASQGNISVTMDQTEDPRLFIQAGTLDVSGNSGGTIDIRVPGCLQQGKLIADGSENGGGISIETQGPFIETTSGSLSVNGSTLGGTIRIDASEGGSFFSSGSYEARGHLGGKIDVLAETIVLSAASLHADGETEGGAIHVGGGLRGQDPQLTNAKTVHINNAANLSANGHLGGSVIVWSDEKTEHYGRIEATGAQGFIEVSGKTLRAGGPTQAETVLFDPDTITIDSTAGVYPQYQFIDPTAGQGTFGSSVMPLSTGNVVITKPDSNVNGTNSGSLYLYNGATAALIQVVSGNAGDQLGSGGVVVLTGNGNYLVLSPNWSSTHGAATWASGNTGIPGTTISASNSFIGSNAGDTVGSSAISLVNGNYVVLSPSWSGVGAATRGYGLGGSIGAVSASNSLIGTISGDQIGSGGAVPLTNGNYVVVSPNSNLNHTKTGAVTWGDGLTGTITGPTIGTVSQANSLIGVLAQDQIGSGGVFPLAMNGNYVVLSPNWNGTIGAATWGNGSFGTTGQVTSINSLVGSSAQDQIGSSGILALSNGNYVVLSPQWTHVLAQIGAATWSLGATQGITGTVSTINSLFGAKVIDHVGIGGAALTNGNYVVSSYLVSGAASETGAVTWGNGTSGTTGQVGSSNSIIGSHASDEVGSGGVIALTNGNYVVLSPNWNGDSMNGLGAATWGSGTGPTAITVSAANSLTGQTSGDNVGSGALALSDGNYVVLSVNWNMITGAINWGSGTTGVTGTVTAANSFNGGLPGESFGSHGGIALNNGNYVIFSPQIAFVGTINFFEGGGPVSGTVSPSNSIFGGHLNDLTSLNSTFGRTTLVLPNNDFVVLSAFWNSSQGAFTIGNGSTGEFICGGLGAINATNSVVGGQSNAGAQNNLVYDAVNNTFLARFSNYASGTAGVVIAGLINPQQLTYSRAEAQSMTIQPCFLTTTLNGGSAVTLQANNDIIVNSAISFGPSAGDLTLSAGRSVTINNNITSNGANINIIANDLLSNGVVDSFRSSGDAVLQVGGTINAGGGNILINLASGAGKTYSSSGDLTLQANSHVTTSGSGNITLEAASHNIVMNDNASVTVGSGSILFLAGVNIQSIGPSSVTTGAGGSITLVVDNLFPTPPAIGPGRFNNFFQTLTGSSIALYAGAFGTSTFPPLINGVSYTPGQLTFESYNVYYPSTDPVFFPYHVFYKSSLPVTPTPTVPTAEGFNKFWIAISESLQEWDDIWWYDQLLTNCKYLYIPFRNYFIRPYNFLEEDVCSCQILKPVLRKL